MDNANSSGPEWVFLTDPGCDRPVHREDIYDTLFLVAKLPGWKPDRKRMRCGCTLIPLTWEATRNSIDPRSLAPHLDHLRNPDSPVDDVEGRQ